MICCSPETKATHRFKNGLLENVHAARLDGDADGLLVLAVVHAALEHAINDALKARIDRLGLGLPVGKRHALLTVEVHAFGCKQIQKRQEGKEKRELRI